MSHVAKVDVEIKDLIDLEAACKRIGLELVRGQQTYRWYGEHVGDYPLPEGFSEDELGKCEHAIRVPLASQLYQRREADELPYEIGVVKRRDGKPGYELLWDWFEGGMGIGNSVCGTDPAGQKAMQSGQMPRLKQAYAISAAARVALSRGFRVQETAQADGTVKLFLTK